MHRRFLTLTAAAVAALSLPACGTIIHGSNQEIAFSSTPAGAQVAVDGVVMGQTPVLLNLERKNHHSVRLTLDGYQPYGMTMSRSVDGWIAGNIVFGGLIGLAVDAVTGAMYKLSPDQVDAELQSGGTSAVMHDGQMLVAVVMTPNPEWERIGQLVPQP